MKVSPTMKFKKVTKRITPTAPIKKMDTRQGDEIAVSNNLKNVLIGVGLRSNYFHAMFS